MSFASRFWKKSISMEMLKIEQVIVGSGLRSSEEIKSEPEVVPLQCYAQESLQCFQCFITFSDAKAKERHMRKYHRDEYKQHLQQTNTVFTCYKCEKCFSSSMALSQHQACHSREEKPFSCAYCQKNLSTYTELNHHKRYECIERRYPCSDCGALFPSVPRLRNHRIAVHPDCFAVVSEIRTYQCCKCSQAFQTEEELLRHQENFACDLNCEVKQLGKKRGHRPKTAAHSNEADAKKSKKEEMVEECKEHSESKTEGCQCPSGEPQTELTIPCLETNCDLLFPSVAALQTHKIESHGHAFA